jgi:hypothetical protein
MSQRGLILANSKSHAGAALGNSLNKNFQNFSSAAKSKVPGLENDIHIEEIVEKEEESGLLSLNNSKAGFEENNYEEEKSLETEQKNYFS